MLNPQNPLINPGADRDPYWIPNLDVVTEPDGLGGYQLKTSGGSGGGGAPVQSFLAIPRNGYSVNGLPVLVTYVYDSAGNYVSHSFKNPITGAPTTLPLGTSALSIYAHTDVKIETLTDNTGIVFLRYYYFQDNGDLLFINDVLIDGVTPYTPTGTVVSTSRSEIDELKLIKGYTSSTSSYCSGIQYYAQLIQDLVKQGKTNVNTRILNVAPGALGSLTVNELLFSVQDAATGNALTALQFGLLPGGANAALITPGELAQWLSPAANHYSFANFILSLSTTSRAFTNVYTGNVLMIVGTIV